MARIPSSLVAASGLVGGYGIVRATKKRELGALALVAAGAVAATQWKRATGPATAVALTGLYVAAFAGSHPLAKKLGAWPSVAAVSSGVALASWAAVDRRS
jgi:hypothetical protein